MLWHFYGLQGGGKSWGVVVFAEDFHIKDNLKVFANFKIKFGELIDMEKLLNFQYSDCVIILDEAYGIADSHSHTKSNDLISTVILQSRKRRVEVFFATQNEGDLYKRVREQAERKVFCQNMGTKKEPILRYMVFDAYGSPIDVLQFDTETVKSAYHLFDTYETIMPMQLNTGTVLDEVKQLFQDVPKKKAFSILLNKKNPYIIRDIAETIYDCLELQQYDKVEKLLKSAG